MSRLQSVHAVTTLIALSFLGAADGRFSARAVEGAEPATALRAPDLRQAFNEVLKRSSTSLAREKLAGRVRLEAQSATVVDGNLELTVRPLRPVRDDETPRLMVDLQSLAQDVLEQLFVDEPGARRAELVAAAIKQSTIRLGAPVETKRPGEVGGAEVRAAIQDYIATLERRQLWRSKDYGEIRARLALADQATRLEVDAAPGNDQIRLTWQVAIIDPKFTLPPVTGDLDRLLQEAAAAQQKFLASQIPPLETLIADALAVHVRMGEVGPLMSFETSPPLLIAFSSSLPMEYRNRIEQERQARAERARREREREEAEAKRLAEAQERAARKERLQKPKPSSVSRSAGPGTGGLKSNRGKVGGNRDNDGMVLPPPPPPPQRFTPSPSRLQPAPEQIADATVRPASNDWRPRPESRPSTEWQEAPRSGPYSLDPRRVEPADAAMRPARQDLSVDSLGFVGGTLSALDFSPDESLLAAAGDVIRIWNVRTGELVRVIRAAGKTPGHAGFQDVKFTPDGRQLVAAVKGTQRKLWVIDLGDLSDVAQTLEGHESEVVRLAFSPDARYLTTADDAGVISIWNWDTRQIVRRHELPNQRGKIPVVGQLSFDYDGVVVVDDQLRIWRLRVDEPASPPTVDPLIELLSRRGCVLPGADAVAVPLSAAISSKRLQFVIGGSSKRDGEASYYWAAAYSHPNGALRNSLKIQVQSVEHRFTVMACAASLSGRLCASGDATGLIQVWNPDTGAVLHSFASPTRAIYSVAFGESLSEWRFGRHRYTQEQWRDNHFAPLDERFDFDRRIKSPIPAQEPPRVQQAGGMRVDYDRGARQLSTSNGDRLVASIPLKTRANWDLYSYTLQPVAGLRTGATGDSPALGDAPALGVITCSQDGTVACFDPETLIPRRTFLGHSSRVWAASVSQGQDLGKRLITAGSDGLIKIWSLEDFKPTYNIASLTDDDDRVTYVYPNTPSSSKIAIGDKIESIGGQVPSDWILSEAARTPAQTPASVVVTRNGRRLTVEVMLTDMGDVARPLVTSWISEDGGQWIVWTEDGYFDSSAGATERVGWVQVPADERSARFVTAGQLRESRRRPEIIAAALNSGRAPASPATSIIAQPTATQPQPARTPSASTAVVQPASPQSPPARAAQPPAADAAFVPPPVPPPVHILTPATQTPREQIDVWAVVIVPQDLRAEVTFRVNGNETPATRNIERVRPEGAGVVLPAPPAGFVNQLAMRTIDLAPGDNTIEVLARLPGVRTAVDSARVVVTRTAPEQARTTPTLFWTGIGVNKYSPAPGSPPRAGMQFDNLEYATTDIESVANAVQERSKQSGFPYSHVEMKTLVDNEATRAGITTWFDELADKVKSGDTVAFHVSAHGTTFGPLKDYCIVVYEGDPEKPQRTCITSYDFVTLANRLPTNVRFLLFIDTCRGGGAGDKAHTVANLFHDRLGGVIYAACGPNQAALEKKDWGHGAFSLALREAILGREVASQRWPGSLTPDPLGQNQLHLDHLGGFLRGRVEQLTGHRQSPQCTVQPHSAPNADSRAVKAAQRLF